MNESKAALATFNRLLELKGRPPVHGASDLLDKHGFFGGCADEYNPATEGGRRRCREFMQYCIAQGWAKEHVIKVKQKPPSGKYDLPESRCAKCGKRPSYCRCGGG